MLYDRRFHVVGVSFQAAMIGLEFLEKQMVPFSKAHDAGSTPSFPLEDPLPLWR